MPGLTICSDFMNESIINTYYERYVNGSIDYNSKQYKDYRSYIKKLIKLNAEKMHRIDNFENSGFIKNLSGDNLLEMITNVG